MPHDHSARSTTTEYQSITVADNALTIMTEKKCCIQADHESPMKLLKGNTISSRAKDPKASCKNVFQENTQHMHTPRYEKKTRKKKGPKTGQTQHSRDQASGSKKGHAVRYDTPTIQVYVKGVLPPPMPEQGGTNKNAFFTTSNNTPPM